MTYKRAIYGQVLDSRLLTAAKVDITVIDGRKLENNVNIPCRPYRAVYREVGGVDGNEMFFCSET